MPEIIITSSLLTGLLILMRRLCRNRISRRLQYSLWLLAALRLLMPASLFENPFNIMNRLYPVAERVETWWAEAEVLFGTEQPSFETGTVTAEKQHLPKNTGGSYEEIYPSMKIMDNGPLLQEPGVMPDGKEADNFSIGQLLRKAWYTGMAAMGIWVTSVNILYRIRLSRKRVFLRREGRIRIYVSDNAGTPCLLGILCPVIYLTPGSAQIQKHREFAIVHELIHYRHGDHIWNFVRNLCLIIHWFNPLVWIGVHLAARDCELACDEGVLCLLGKERAQDYGRALIEMAASFRRPWLLFCETALAYGKRGLKERIAHIASGKKNTGILTACLAITCGVMLAMCTFGKAIVAPAMGRYVETVVELTGTAGISQYSFLAQEGKTIRLIARAGLDVLSLDGGLTFETVQFDDMPTGTMTLYERNAIEIAGSIGGARAFQTYNDIRAKGTAPFSSVVITENGEEFQPQDPEIIHTRYFYSNGSFFAVELNAPSNRYYKIDPVTCEMQFLMENKWTASHAAADEGLLYLTGESGVLLYDLETGEIAAKQDQALSDFVAENACLWESFPAILYPYGNGVYILNHKGLYWHELYDKKIIQIIDGASCTIGDSRKLFNGMVLRETGAEPEFLILYNDRYLMRYTYDASLPAIPDAP